MDTEGEGLVDRLRAEIDRLKEENEKLRASNRRWMRIAGTDALTGLPNKVYLTTALLPQQISQSDEQGEPFACLIVAPDGLGEINQKHGREAGDEVIQGVASFLKDSVEPHERLVHFDGANFVILLPKGDLAVAKRRALALRARLVSRPFIIADERLTITISVGSVSRSPDPSGRRPDPKGVADLLLGKLSRALDRAKREGHDKLVEDPQTDF